jgi:integrase
MRTPKYRTRPDKDWAFVEIGGRRISLPGKKNSRESKDAYHKLLATLVSSAPTEIAAVPDSRKTVAWLIGLYTESLLRSGIKTGTLSNIRSAMRPLAVLYADRSVSDFGPVALEQVRDAMSSGSWIPVGSKCERLSRSVVNRNVSYIRRMFKWGVRKELIAPSILHGLQAAEPLRRGAGLDQPPVLPVELRHVDATLPFMASSVVADMVRLQRLTGMRSDNLCTIRPCEIDRSSPVWVYTPAHNKSEHIGRVLEILLGPQSQRVLKQYLDRDPMAYCFSPAESEELRYDELRRSCKKPRYVTDRKHKRTKQYLDHYSPKVYWSVIRNAIKAANKAAKDAAKKAGKTEYDAVPHWHPHQLRHTVASDVRKRFGVEGAQVYLGHSKADVTQIYAERDMELAARVASECG